MAEQRQRGGVSLAGSFQGAVRLAAVATVAALATRCADVTAPAASLAAAISLSPSQATLDAVGASVELAAAVTDREGRELTGAAIEWRSGTPSVARVTGSGRAASVTALAIGESKISATVRGSGSLVATTTVVVAPVVTSLQINPASHEFTALDDTIRLVARSLDRLGSDVPAARIEWRSSDERVATVSRQGLVTAVGNGVATVAASAGALAESTTVAVAQRATHMGFLVQPTDASPERAIVPAVRVGVLDARGNPVAEASDSVAISLTPGASTGQLSGATVAPLVDGVATFANLALDSIGGPFRLEARSGAFPAVRSVAFVVRQIAVGLSFVEVPNSWYAGEPATVTVAVVDDRGGRVAGAVNPVTLRLRANQAGALIVSQTTANAEDGLASFRVVALDAGLPSYRLQAVSPALASATSPPFPIMPPVSANAGADLEATMGREVTLNGGGSTGQGLSYSWRQVSGPPVALTSQDARPAFTAPATVSTLEFELTVSDGVRSSTDWVTVWALAPGRSYWVHPGGRDDNPGTRSAPLRTIQRAISVANAAGGGSLYIASGRYDGPVSLRPWVSLYGGFDPARWLRAPLVNVTTIASGPEGVQGTGADSLTLDGLALESRDAVGPKASSAGLTLRRSVGVSLSGLRIVTGAGSPGAHGRDGFSYPLIGDAGGDARGIGGGLGGVGPAWPGGTGGSGGYEGEPGQPGVGDVGGAGGLPGRGGDDGRRGGDGGNGDDGAHGTSGVSFGTMTALGYRPADGIHGEQGDDASGGGGGGGGGGVALSDIGGGGGGGGAGGEPGTEGAGGEGGGGSFGILLLDGTTAMIRGSTILVGNGGHGGHGGVGGLGAPGGPGGAGSEGRTPGGSRGGDGGRGGRGGHGGSGGGGGGGPSVGLVLDETSVSNVVGGNLGDNVIVLGAPGAGGRHGAPDLPGGATGMRITILELTDEGGPMWVDPAHGVGLRPQVQGKARTHSTSTSTSSGTSGAEGSS